VALIEPARLEDLALGLEGVLAARGIPRSTPLAFRAEAEPNAVTLALALFRIGRTLVPLHTRWTLPETTRALGLVPDALSLSTDEVHELVDRAQHATPVVLPESRPDDLAAIVFTSGTSAEPKAVLLERRAFEASARASATNLGWRDDDRWLLGLPFAHVGGLSILTRVSLARKKIVLGASDPEALLTSDATLVSVVPAQLHRLLELDRENRLARFRVVLVGGAEFPLELRRETEARGIVALASYGLTETCSQVATQSPADRRDAGLLDSGRALQGAELRIRDGRIEVRGAMAMRGYVGAPALERDEFFTTGDLGHFDETGRLFVLGRADDVIISGGENVHPVEIERALSKCPHVRHVLCFGVPDARWGEIVAVALVLDSSSRGVAALGSALADLATYKHPRRFAVVEASELPRGATGKLDRSRAGRALADKTEPWPATSGNDTM
jgi:O-succinylbenzoic acid--CoA ligase